MNRGAHVRAMGSERDAVAARALYWRRSGARLRILSAHPNARARRSERKEVGRA